MINRTNVEALIPAYLEELHIADVVRRTRTYLEQVIVIDDASTDATSTKAIREGACVLRHEINRGKGAAIKTGFKDLMNRDIQYVIILDGDGQHCPEEIPLFLEEAQKSNAPFLLGNRMENVTLMPLIRKLTNQLMSAQISRVCGQSIPDTQCGFRMIHRDLIPHLFCETNGYDYETEMILIASLKGFKITPVPVSTVYSNEISKIHPVKDTLRFLKLMAKYRRQSKLKN